MDQQWLNTYREEIGGFSNTIHSFAQGEIARKDYKGISGGFGSYAQRDAAKHMLRLRLPGGRVTPERLHLWHRLFSSTMCHPEADHLRSDPDARFDPGRGACHHGAAIPAALSPAAAAVITPATFRPAP